MNTAYRCCNGGGHANEPSRKIAIIERLLSATESPFVPEDAERLAEQSESQLTRLLAGLSAPARRSMADAAEIPDAYASAIAARRAAMKLVEPGDDDDDTAIGADGVPDAYAAAIAARRRELGVY